ncbi:hypothetical protein AB1Y20_002362 [Prymnesium parvum]|uniref:Uncharacterized protein n=1 Tax=Prymnesium parvum TaxID=97485 RepID=A0AB34JAW7_PRYPA
MGASVTKEEKAKGTAVASLSKKIEMPSFAKAEQLPVGMHPGKGWLKKTPPEGVVSFLESKGCYSLYEDFKAEVSKEGSSLFGWNSKKIQEVTLKYKPMFKEKGVDLFYCMGFEWAYNSEDFYYYMCFSAPGPFDGDWKPADEYVVGNEETCSCTARKKP